jgi:hypothetical protein
MKAYGGSGSTSPLFLTFTLDSGEWSPPLWCRSVTGKGLARHPPDKGLSGLRGGLDAVYKRNISFPCLEYNSNYSVIHERWSNRKVEVCRVIYSTSCNMHDIEQKYTKSFDSKTWRKETIAKPRRGWEDNNKMDLRGLGLGPVAGICKYDNEPSGCMKCWEFLLERVSNC